VKPGWTEVTLGEVSTARLGKMLSKTSKSGKDEMPYLGNADVQWGSIRVDGLRTMNFTPAEQEEFSLRPGDVLICEGGEVGRTAVVEEELPGIYFQKALHRVRCSDRLSPRYLFHYMRHTAGRGGFRDYTSQATIAHLTGVKLRTFPIPLPPLEEQKRIAAILDKADELQAKRHAAIAHLTSLSDCMFIDMFGDPRNPTRRGSCVPNGEVSLAELTESTRPICYGVLKPGPDEEAGVPLIRITDLVDGTVDTTRLHRVSQQLDEEFHRSRLSGGEVLISIQGTIGRVGLCPPKLAGANISRTIALISPDERVSRRFLCEFLKLKRGDFQIAGSTRASLNIGELRKIRVPLFKGDDQREFDAFAARVDAQRAVYESSTACFASLRLSAVDRAFQGEL
jgi:type I restriction enzyme S subunit